MLIQNSEENIRKRVSRKSCLQKEEKEKKKSTREREKKNQPRSSIKTDHLSPPLPHLSSSLPLPPPPTSPPTSARVLIWARKIIHLIYYYHIILYSIIYGHVSGDYSGVVTELIPAHRSPGYKRPSATAP